jgi:hypothetical protein
LWEWTKDKSTADEAVRTASDTALKLAIERATKLAGHFFGGKELIKVGNELLAPREVGKLIYYGLVMCGGKVELPDSVMWKLVNFGLVHMQKAVPVLHTTPSQDEYVPPTSSRQEIVTVAEPIMQFGMQKALENADYDPILSELLRQLTVSLHHLGKGLSYQKYVANLSLACQDLNVYKVLCLTTTSCLLWVLAPLLTLTLMTKQLCVI